jgi:hypothetical protein
VQLGPLAIRASLKPDVDHQTRWPRSIRYCCRQRARAPSRHPPPRPFSPHLQATLPPQSMSSIRAHRVSTAVPTEIPAFNERYQATGCGGLSNHCALKSVRTGSYGDPLRQIATGCYVEKPRSGDRSRTADPSLSGRRELLRGRNRKSRL